MELCNQATNTSLIVQFIFTRCLTEFADEDRAFAEAGMSDYAVMLHQAEDN
jgi:hypothetical protein